MYKPTGVENLAGAGVAKIGMPGPGLALVFKVLINQSDHIFNFYGNIKSLARQVCVFLLSNIK